MIAPTLQELLATQGYLKDRVRTLTQERNCLPRNDRETAHRLLTEINKLTREERDLRPSIARAREAEEKQEQHNLWCACIIELYGPQELPRCFDWMKQERKARRAAQKEAA
jgi:hypothetical protein